MSFLFEDHDGFLAVISFINVKNNPRIILAFSKYCFVLQAALKDAKQNNMVDKEIASIRSEVDVSMPSIGLLKPSTIFSWCFYLPNLSYISCLIQNAKDEAAAVMRQLQGAESEVKALRSMTQRMILTQKEMVRSRIDSSGSLIIA